MDGLNKANEELIALLEVDIMAEDELTNEELSCYPKIRPRIAITVTNIDNSFKKCNHESREASTIIFEFRLLDKLP